MFVFCLVKILICEFSLRFIMILYLLSPIFYDTSLVGPELVQSQCSVDQCMSVVTGSQ